MQNRQKFEQNKVEHWFGSWICPLETNQKLSNLKTRLPQKSKPCCRSKFFLAHT